MYEVSIAESLNRILRTPLGARVMRPEFGSELYKLRDREFNDEYRLLAAKYTYEAISKYEPRVRVKKVECKIEPISGVVVLSITLDNGKVIEVQND